jgi:hypothetical protein
VLSALEPAAHGTGKNPDQVAVLVTASALLVSYPDDMMRSLSNSSSLAGATGRRISQDFLQYSANDI